MYEERLRKDFLLLQQLAASEASDVIDIYYLERGGGEDIDNRYAHWKSIREKPSSPLYPFCFRVTYTMPMYVGPNKLKRDWKGTFLFKVPESVLMDMHSKMGVKIEGGAFPPGSIPFHNHVNRTFVCTGDAWTVAQQGFGIWYFLLLIGSLLNQESFMMDVKPHLNADALRFWESRNRRPTSDIKWPFNLDTRRLPARRQASTTTPSTPRLRIGSARASSPPSVKFGRKTTATAPSPGKITFGAKK